MTDIPVTPESAREALHRLDGMIGSPDGFLIENAITCWEHQQALIEQKDAEIEQLKYRNKVADLANEQLGRILRETKDERDKYRQEAGNERELTQDIVAEREELIIDNEKQAEENKQLRQARDSAKVSARAARKIAGQRLDFIEKMEKENKELRERLSCASQAK